MARSTPAKGVFQPDKLIAPTLQTASEDYAIYLASYSLYLDGLRAFRHLFWAEAEQTKTSGAALWRLDKKEVDRPTVKSTIDENTKKVVKTTEHHIRAQVWPTQLGRQVKQPKSVVEPQPKTEAQIKEFKGRRAAKRRRQRAARRSRDILKAKKLAGNVAQLEAQNKALHRLGANSNEKIEVTRSGKLLISNAKTADAAEEKTSPPKVAKVVASAKAEAGSSKPKGKTEAKVPKAAKPSAPEVTKPARPVKAEKAKESTVAPAPNRKERRRAIYGPPAEDITPKGKTIPLPEPEPVVPVVDESKILELEQKVLGLEKVRSTLADKLLSAETFMSLAQQEARERVPQSEVDAMEAKVSALEKDLAAKILLGKHYERAVRAIYIGYSGRSADAQGRPVFSFDEGEVVNDEIVSRIPGLIPSFQYVVRQAAKKVNRDPTMPISDW